MGETTGSVSGAQHDDVRDIRHDIRRTQHDISRTLDAIQERLSPHHLMQQTKNSVKNSVRRAGVTTSRKFIDKVRDNPVPAAMVGVGLWLLMRDNASDRSRDTGLAGMAHGRVVDNEYELYGFDTGLEDYADAVLARSDRNSGNSRMSNSGHEVRDRLGRSVQTARSGVAEAVGTAKERVSGVVSSATDRAHDVIDSTADRTSTLAETAAERARRIARQARGAGRSASVHSRDFFFDSPLIAGLAALTVGAIIGAAIPETEREREMMGDTRDQLAGRARDLASQGLQHAKTIATSAAQSAKETAVDQARTAAGEMKNEIRSAADSAKSDISGNIGVTSARETSDSSPATTSRATSDVPYGTNPPSGSR